MQGLPGGFDPSTGEEEEPTQSEEGDGAMQRSSLLSSARRLGCPTWQAVPPIHFPPMWERFETMSGTFFVPIAVISA